MFMAAKIQVNLRHSYDMAIETSNCLNNLNFQVVHLQREYH